MASVAAAASALATEEGAAGAPSANVGEVRPSAASAAGVGGVAAAFVPLQTVLEASYEPHGRGAITYSNGDGFEGDWEAGHPHGFGTATYAGGESYTGDWNRGDPSGEGSYFYAIGDVYRGELESRKREGIGRCTYASGATYEGGWRDDVWHSAAADGATSSLYHSASGDRYEGNFIRGKIVGRGSIHFHQGDRYEGMMDGFDRHGVGTCTYGIGQAVYEGQWVKDGREGKGTLTSKSSESYDGDWKADKPHGMGVRTGADGSKEEGQFARGGLHGAGERKDAFGNVWRGSFADGKQEGEGSCEVEGAKYVGSFSNGLYDGTGEMRYPDGTSYSGGWAKGKAEGSGRRDYLDSSKYDGMWLDGKRHGKGVLFKPAPLHDVDGKSLKEYDGEWFEDEMVGEAHLTYYSGETYEGHVASPNGVYHGKGCLRKIDGTEIDGVFMSGVPNGPCLVIYPNGDRYEGDMKDGKRCGEGNCVYSNGDKYEGGWLDDLRDGEGLMEYARGGSYKGGWCQDDHEGEGELALPDGRIAKGTFKGGEILGPGVLLLPTGGRYDGGLQRLSDGNIVPSGYGEATAGPLSPEAVAAERASPTFARSGGSPIFHHGGFATTLPGGVIHYKGEWSYGLPEGDGTAKYEDGGYYIGHLMRGLREGKGIMRYVDGAEHDGEWLEGEPHGEGVSVDGLGTVTTHGNWVEGVLTGAAHCSYSNGDVYHGTCDGPSRVRSGEGKCTYANGVEYDGAWYEDEPHGVGTMKSTTLLATAAGSKVVRTWRGKAPKLMRGDSLLRMEDFKAMELTVDTQSFEVGEDETDGAAAPSASAASSPSMMVSLLASADAPPVEYSGEWVRGQMHGAGTIHFLATGESLRAPFRDGVIEGHGVLTTAANVALEGRFEGLSLIGRAIVRQVEPGDTSQPPSPSKGISSQRAARGWFDGDVDNSVLEASLRAATGARIVRHGKGEARLPNGDRYEGAWVANVPHGEGSYTYLSADATYTGEWVEGRRHGKGILAGGNLDHYEGEWRDGVRCGEGTQKLGETGDLLVGTWEADRMVGEGTLTTGRGDKYVGTFVNSLRDGKGDCTYADGSVYKGTWSEGLFHGEGTLTGVGNAICEGHWHRGEMVGFGRRVYDSGEIYEGEFARGLRHGHGRWKDDARGATYVGEWADDLREGRGTYSTTDGVRQEGTWRQDRLHGPSCHDATGDVSGTTYDGAFDNGRRGGNSLVDLAALRSLLSKWTAALEMRVAAGLFAPSATDVIPSALAELMPRFLKECESTAEVFGYGCLTSIGGEVYEGFFRDGLQTGPGLWLSPILNDPDVGETRSLSAALADRQDGKPACCLGAFKGGALTGVGMAIVSENVVYVGGFLNWQPSGHGTRFHADGSIYMGQWESGAYHGVGELRAASIEAAEAAAEAKLKSASEAILKEAEAVQAKAVAEAAAVARANATYNPATATITIDMPRVKRDPTTGLTTIVSVTTDEAVEAELQSQAAAEEAAAKIAKLKRVALAELSYNGSWLIGQRAGEGRAEYADGSSYYGQWKDDLPHGRGTRTVVSGGEYGGGGYTYSGEMVEGVRCGVGTLRLHESGDTVEGEWAEDGTLSDAVVRFAGGGQYDGDLDSELRPHGDGRRVYADGTRYSGAFLHGARDGHGVCTTATGEEYDGGWLNDQRHGRGTQRDVLGGTYEGTFKEGLRSGHGLMRFPDGSSYEGEWVADRYEGIGNLYHKPTSEGNDMYGGHWKDGKEDGHGVYSYANGARYDGEHSNGRRHGEGVLTLRDGSMLKATWVDGSVRGTDDHLS